MNINIKSILSTLTFSLLMITCSSHSMDLNNEMRALVQEIHNKTTEIKNAFQAHKYTPLKGTITLVPGAKPAYGSASFIQSLKDANIPTREKEGLVQVSVNMCDTKNNNLAITDWTKETPTIITEETGGIADALNNDIENGDLRIAETLYRTVDIERKNMLNPLPTHMPVSLLTSKPIELNLFGVYPVKLTFKQNQLLQQYLRPFYNSPAIVTPLTPNTKAKLLDNKRSSKLPEKKIIKMNNELLSDKLQETKEELEKKNIILFRNPTITDVTLVNGTIKGSSGSATRAISTYNGNNHSKIGY